MSGARNSRTATIAIALVLLVGGCADSEPQPAPREVSGPPEAVARVVDRLEQAIRARDFDKVCDELLTPAARARAGGRRCAETMRESVADLRRPRIKLLAINISGRVAEARVRTRAADQAPVEETLHLQRSGRRYLITALGR